MTNDTMRFDNEVVLVAGGGGSLGSAYARLFGARGAKVVVNDIGDSAQAVADQINAAGGTAIAAIASTVSEAASIVQKTLDAYGRLDVVVNSSGQTNGGLFHLIPTDDWDRVFASHFTSTLELARAAWPHLSASGNGRLINMSSTSIFGAEYTSTYIAAKGAIFAVGKAWALEGRSQNVRVNTILPTAISPMTAMIPDEQIVEMLREHFQPERVAGLVAWLAHKSNTLSGYTLEVGGGRAANVFLAQPKPVFVNNAESPEAWQGQEAALTSTVVEYTPASMFDELRLRIESLGFNADALKTLGGDIAWQSPAR
jgi:NAD(P)-dependent dehydrogenase (short-subunit alcohol dehydrogenase family)